MGSSLNITCFVDSRSILGEGPVWDCAAQCLWWVDIKGHLLHRTLMDGRTEHFDIGEPVGCCAPAAQGGLVLATQSGLWRFDPATGTRTEIARPEQGRIGNRFNDGTTDRQGRLWAGTMRDDGIKEPVGSLYRLDRDLSLTRVIEGMWTPNGLAFAPDGRTMYLAESHKEIRKIWAFDYDPDTGTPSNRRVFFDTMGQEGRPDGGTVDAEGGYWMAAIDGWAVKRIRPDGTLDRVIELPIERPTKPMWGGPGLDTLFVTSLRLGLTPDRPQPQAGSLFAITGTGFHGVPEIPFAG